MPLSRPLILVVDDEAGFRFLLQNRLEKRGYRVDFACSGLTALAKINSLASPPHLVIADFKMPGMDGCELLSRVREHPSLNLTPFMMMTGFPTKKQLETCHSLGVIEIFEKPFSYTAMVKKIDSFFEVQREFLRLSAEQNDAPKAAA